MFDPGHLLETISSIEQQNTEVVLAPLVHDHDEEAEVAAYVKKLLSDALLRADESPQPDPSTLTEGVYATPEDLDTPHHP